MRFALLVLQVGLVAGCAPHLSVPIFVAPSSILAEREALRSGRSVTVIADGFREPITVQPTQTVGLFRGSVHLSTVRLDQVLRTCGASASTSTSMPATVAADMERHEPASFCGTPGVSQIQLGSMTLPERDWRGVKLGLAAGGVVVGGGVGLCAAVCENRTLQGMSIAVVGVGVAAVIVSVILQLAEEDRE